MSNTSSPLRPSDESDTSDKSDLRRKVENKAALSPDNNKSLSLNETRLMIHELRVHQIELEMQNEELRQAQEELNASRVRYFDLYDLAPVGYLTLNEAGLIQEANLTASTLLGVLRSKLVGQPISKFILKDDADTFYLFRKKLLTTGEPQTCDLRMAKSDDESFWAHLSATAARSAGNNPVFRLVLVDITERKRAEAALQASEIQLLGILEATADGILAVDNEGKVVKANSRFAELWRVPESLLKSLDDNALLAFVVEQLSEPEAFLRKVQLLYKSDAVDMDVIVFKDGRIFERYSVPTLMAGRVSGRVWSFRDISARKQTETELMKKYNDLDRINTVMVGRELRMIELKAEVNALLNAAGQPDKYRIIKEDE